MVSLQLLPTFCSGQECHFDEKASSSMAWRSCDPQLLPSSTGSTGAPKTTLHYLLKGRKPPQYANGETIFVRHSSRLKPTLTNENKLSRFMFAMKQVQQTPAATWAGHPPHFDGQYNKVHIDEKWFNLSKDGKRYILVLGEDAPKRHVQHKKFISKVMFLCAVAPPRWDVTKKMWWDGKLGMWPIGYYDVAQRTNVHRPRGTPVWKNATMDHAC